MALRYLAVHKALIRRPAIAEYEAAFAREIGGRFAFSFWAGRVGLYALLLGFGGKSGDEVLLQAPTHAAVFTGRSRRGGKVLLELELERLGIVFKHSRPYHPQTCGKVKRFHQTLKRFLRMQPPAHSIAELQFQLDVFLEYYNNRKPHRALGRQTPLAVFNSRIKAKPALQPAPTDHRVRRDKIDSFGKLTLRYVGKLRHIPVGVEHKNRKVSLLVAGPDVRIVAENGELIRALTLDPTRNYQPLGGRWPVHNVLPQACTMS